MKHDLKVKKLVWDKSGENTIGGAVDYEIHYDVDEEGKDVYRFAPFRQEEAWLGYYDFRKSPKFTSLQQAQNAAQAHYEKLIFEAIE